MGISVTCIRCGGYLDIKQTVSVGYPYCGRRCLPCHQVHILSESKKDELNDSEKIEWLERHVKNLEFRLKNIEELIAKGHNNDK